MALDASDTGKKRGFLNSERRGAMAGAKGRFTVTDPVKIGERKLKAAEAALKKISANPNKPPVKNKGLEFPPLATILESGQTPQEKQQAIQEKLSILYQDVTELKKEKTGFFDRTKSSEIRQKNNEIKQYEQALKGVTLTIDGNIENYQASHENFTGKEVFQSDFQAQAVKDLAEAVRNGNSQEVKSAAKRAVRALERYGKHGDVIKAGGLEISLTKQNANESLKAEIKQSKLPETQGFLLREHEEAKREFTKALANKDFDFGMSRARLADILSETADQKLTQALTKFIAKDNLSEHDIEKIAELFTSGLQIKLRTVKEQKEIKVADNFAVAEQSFQQAFKGDIEDRKTKHRDKKNDLQEKLKGGELGFFQNLNIKRKIFSEKQKLKRLDKRKDRAENPSLQKINYAKFGRFNRTALEDADHNERTVGGLSKILSKGKFSIARMFGAPTPISKSAKTVSRQREVAFNKLASAVENYMQSQDANPAAVLNAYDEIAKTRGRKEINALMRNLSEELQIAEVPAHKLPKIAEKSSVKDAIIGTVLGGGQARIASKFVQNREALPKLLDLLKENKELLQNNIVKYDSETIYTIQDFAKADIITTDADLQKIKKKGGADLLNETFGALFAQYPTASEGFTKEQLVGRGASGNARLRFLKQLSKQAQKSAGQDFIPVEKMLDQFLMENRHRVSVSGLPEDMQTKFFKEGLRDPNQLSAFTLYRAMRGETIEKNDDQSVKSLADDNGQLRVQGDKWKEAERNALKKTDFYAMRSAQLLGTSFMVGQATGMPWAAVNPALCAIPGISPGEIMSSGCFYAAAIGPAMMTAYADTQAKNERLITGDENKNSGGLSEHLKNLNIHPGIVTQLDKGSKQAVAALRTHKQVFADQLSDAWNDVVTKPMKMAPAIVKAALQDLRPK